MSVTILEALLNAEINIPNGPLGMMVAKPQLHNAIVLLEKNYSIHDKVEPLLEEYGKVEDVPEKAR